MDLNQLNFTRRKFKSGSILYNEYLLGFDSAKSKAGSQYKLLKISGDSADINPKDNNIDPNGLPKSIEVTFVPFEYPNPGNKTLIAYGPNMYSNGMPCFLNPLKDSINLQGKNINEGGPGSRLGIALQRSKYNLWAFGGYPGAGGTKSAAGSYFFLFNGTSDNWVDKTDLAIKANIPNLVYHTMTNVNDEYLIIIGGGTYDSQGILEDKLFDKVYKFDLNKETWSTTSLANYPVETRIGHTATIVNGNLIVIGGTDNQQESKLNIYPDMLSIDPNTLKHTYIDLKYQNGSLTNIKRAFHATIYIDGYLILNPGMQEAEYANQEIFIDTYTWTRKFKFKDLELPSKYSFISPKIESESNTNTIIYSVVGVVLFLIFLGFFYYVFIIRKRKKRELNNTQELTGKIDIQEPVVEWVKSDSQIIRLDNEEVFTLDYRARSRISNEADRAADLHYLNSFNLTYKNNSFTKQNTPSNRIQGFSRMFTNSTLVNNVNIDEDNTLASSDLSKD